MEGGRWEALAVENIIERVDQVGRRIHKRGVEIENNSAGRSHRKPLSVLAQSCKVGRQVTVKPCVRAGTIRLTRGSPAAKVVNCGQIGRMVLFLPAKRRYMPARHRRSRDRHSIFPLTVCTS